MKDSNSARETRAVAPARIAAAAALAASLALVGHVGGASLATRQLSGRVALLASGSLLPDSPMPCPGPNMCNVG